MAEFMAVLEAAQRRSDALVAKDLDALDTLLHPNFTYVNTSGQVLSRQQYLDNYVIPGLLGARLARDFTELLETGTFVAEELRQAGEAACVR